MAIASTGRWYVLLLLLLYPPECATLSAAVAVAMAWLVWMCGHVGEGEGVGVGWGVCDTWNHWGVQRQARVSRLAGQSQRESQLLAAWGNQHTHL